MQQTPNLNLNKPDGTDVVDIADLNANMDIIDAKLGATGHNHNGTAGNGPKIAYDSLTGAPIASGATPLINGTASVGTDNGKFAREGHVHPTDTTRAPLASPALTGTPTAPTAAAGTNTAQIATTAFIATAIANLVASSPAALDTLNELAAALGNDPNFATTMTNALAAKAPVASPNLAGTPTAPTAAAGTNTAQLATTAFVQAVLTANSYDSAHSFAESGYQKLSNGLILQWGTAVNTSSTLKTVTVVFPIAFPNAALNLVSTFVANEDSNNNFYGYLMLDTLTKMGATIRSYGGLTSGKQTFTYYFAIGY